MFQHPAFFRFWEAITIYGRFLLEFAFLINVLKKMKFVAY